MVSSHGNIADLDLRHCEVDIALSSRRLPSATAMSIDHSLPAMRVMIVLRRELSIIFC